MARCVADVIVAGVAALAAMQGSDGSFPLFTGGAATRWSPCGRLFSTAYIMLGAGRLMPPNNIARAVAFIRSQRRPDGLWEYDPALRIPPDADSTACALAALMLHGYGSDVAGGAELLRCYWRIPTGPFRTWKAPGIWSLPERDDVVVNCNVMLALRLMGSPATVVEQVAVRRLIQQTNGRSRYYCAPATLAHAVRRAGVDDTLLPDVATARPEPGDLIGAVRWLCAVSEPDAAVMAAVLAAQQPDGSWPLSPWVTGVGDPTPFWGSPAITTALAIEALERHSDRPKESADSTTSPGSAEAC
jgi:hypothetical protein